MNEDDDTSEREDGDAPRRNGAPGQEGAGRGQATREDEQGAGQGQPIDSRRAFEDAIRSAFVRAADASAREIVIVDPTFADWPLGERSVVEALSRWVDSRRTLTVFAHGFDDIARRHVRFVAWRREWSHVVQCRSDPELEVDEVPGLMLVPGLLCVRLLDRVRVRGFVSDRPTDLHACRETIDALLQRSVEAFPATTLGL